MKRKNDGSILVAPASNLRHFGNFLVQDHDSDRCSYRMSQEQFCVMT